ncbi:hypothetical protein [Frankia sp. CcWB3]
MDTVSAVRWPAERGGWAYRAPVIDGEEYPSRFDTRAMSMISSSWLEADE